MAKKKKKAKKAGARRKGASDDAAEQLLAGLRGFVGRRVSAAREELGLSQGDLAQRMGMSKAWLAGIERGRQFAPLWFLKVLASAAGWPVGRFVGEDEEEPTYQSATAALSLEALETAGSLLQSHKESAWKAAALALTGKPEGELSPEDLEVGRRTVENLEAGSTNVLELAGKLHSRADMVLANIRQLLDNPDPEVVKEAQDLLAQAGSIAWRLQRARIASRSPKGD